MEQKIKGWSAVDPDGYEFFYEKIPSLGLNKEGKLTWIAQSGSRVIFLGKVNIKDISFQNSLKIIY